MDPIAFEKFTLPNGLDVILHQDRALPLMAVNVWYHVGSKDEETGKTGFAHLFEHLMFEGSKNHNRSHFDALQKVGASLNGSTDIDRTNYWEDLPSNYLELALWLESDRMGFLLDAVDQRRFDIQRDVVKNERRQSYENRPYGLADLRLQSATYPLPHPYHWPTIGFHEDLDAADLDDVRAFFLRFYTPSNASLALAGDFDLESTRALVERYFGDLPPGPALPRAGRTDSPLQGHADVTLYDRVLLPRFYETWPTVPRFHPDDAPLSMLAAILGDGRSSRLHRTLVHERRIAQTVSVFHGPAEIAGDFQVEITAAAGHTATEVGEAALAEIERLRSVPPEPEELARTKNRLEWRHVRQAASIGGFGGKANRLNSFNVYAGDLDLVNRDLERFLAVEPEDIRRVADRYLGDRHVRLVVLPEPERSHAAPAFDRTVEPPPAVARPFTPPLPQRSRLDNGLQLLTLEMRGIPAVGFALLVGTGGASDPSERPGLASFTTAMLQEGTRERSSQRISDDFEHLGIRLAALTSREHTTLGAEALTRHWPAALELVADLARNAAFPEDELTRVRDQRLTMVRRFRDDASAIADRVTAGLFYGRGTPEGHPLSGTEAALESIGRDDLVRHYRTGFSPERATLIVVGDVAMDEARGIVEERLGGWTGDGAVTATDEPGGERPRRASTTIYLVDKSGAAQSVIRAGHLSVPRKHPDYFKLLLLNHTFGGQFTGRLNMNLRQDKGYSYGYRSWFEWRPASSVFLAGGSVQTAVTREGVEETLREFSDIGGGRPLEEGEFEDAKASVLRQFPSSFETQSQVLDQLTRLVSFDLPDDYYGTLTAAIEGVSLDDVRQTARERVESDRLAVLVVGDASVIEPGLRGLGYPVVILDHEGREL